MYKRRERPAAGVSPAMSVCMTHTHTRNLHSHSDARGSPRFGVISVRCIHFVNDCVTDSESGGDCVCICAPKVALPAASVSARAVGGLNRCLLAEAEQCSDVGKLRPPSFVIGGAKQEGRKHMCRLFLTWTASEGTCQLILQL